MPVNSHIICTKTDRFEPVKAFSAVDCFLVVMFQPFRSHQMQRVVCYLRVLLEIIVYLSRMGTSILSIERVFRQRVLTLLLACIVSYIRHYVTVAVFVYLQVARTLADMRSKRSAFLFQAVVLRCALLVACLFVVATLGAPEDERRPKISDEALERALNDKRYLQRQLKCALGEASCDSVGRRLKSECFVIARNLFSKTQHQTNTGVQ